MRKARTVFEQSAISELISELRERGCAVEENSAITDRPDAVINVDGRTIAVECRSFTPERYFELHGAKLTSGSSRMLYLPIEPQIWLEDAVKSKEQNISLYKARAESKEAWLLLHYDLKGFMHIGEIYEHFSDLFHMGVWSRKQLFDRIYIAGKDTLKPICLYSNDLNEEYKARYASKNLLRVPIVRHIYCKVTATEGEDGKGKINFNINTPFKDKYLLQPLNKEFHIDYSDVEKIISAGHAFNSLPHYLYAEKVCSA